jgi:F420-dependent oxidoreductase-like protein
VRIGIFGGATTVDAAVEAAKQAAADGFASYWLPQIFSIDALTALAVVGREVPGIELGTAVVPTYPRYPMALAAQALTVQSATGGRLVLGIGLSHQIVVEGMWGFSFEHPLRHMREYLTILRGGIHGETVQFEGETLKAMMFAPLDVAGVTPCPILVAALGPKMLKLAGQLADGTITWMTGPATLAEHTVPTLTKAAADAGRPPPRVAVGLPVCVTDDPDGARQRAAGVFSIYGTLPSYRAMLDREGAAGPADVAIVGDEATVAAGIKRLADVGTTDFTAVDFAEDETEKQRTRAVLKSLVL